MQTHITPIINSSLHIEMRDQAFVDSPFHGRRPSLHAHPELELTVVLEGYGKRIIGNKIDKFQAGDMVFLGPGVPHIWLSDPAFYKEDTALRSKVIVMYINPKIFEQMFESMTELRGIQLMIQQASMGINIFGKTKKLIAEKLIDLFNKTGFEKVKGCLEIMHLISISEEKNFIAEKALDAAAVGSSSDRLLDVIQYIKENISSPVSLKDVAEVACMTIPSFCRFFKSRTKMRFSQYLMEERMEHARQLLIEMDKPISEIAALCGYNSDSHFCKVFKDHTGQSPHQYKSAIGFTGLS